MPGGLFSEDQICESGGYKKQDQHYDRHDIADHEAVQTGTFEMLAISFYFSDDPVRSDYQPIRILVSREINGIRKLLLM